MTRQVSITLASQVVYVSGYVNGEACIFTLSDTTADGTVWTAEAARARLDIYDISITAVDAAGNAATYNMTIYYGLNLAIDREQSDVEYAAEMRSKGVDGMTDKELERWLEGLKGTYNAADLNRVETAVEYVSEKLASVGIHLGLSVRKNWAMEDLPHQSDMQRYLGNVQKIRDSIMVTVDTPELTTSMNNLTYEEANDIEKVLMHVNILLENMMKAWFYSDEIYAGEV